MMVGISANLETNVAKEIPNAIPIMPPETLIITASNRNCETISVFFAPSESRNPISLMRSSTEASIMFMMPIPPTNKRYASNGTQNKIENLVGALLLFQQQFRNGNLIVNDPIMPTFQHPGNYFRNMAVAISVSAYLHHKFIKLVVIG